MFELKKLDIWIGVLARVMASYTEEEYKDHPDDIKELLDMQRTLMSLRMSLKKSKI